MKDFEKSKSCHLHEKHSTTFSFFLTVLPNLIHFVAPVVC